MPTICEGQIHLKNLGSACAVLGIAPVILDVNGIGVNWWASWCIKERFEEAAQRKYVGTDASNDRTAVLYSSYSVYLHPSVLHL